MEYTFEELLLTVAGVTVGVGIIRSLSHKSFVGRSSRRKETALLNEEIRVRQALDVRRLGSLQRIYPIIGDGFCDVDNKMITVRNDLGSQDYSVDLEESLRKKDYLPMFIKGIAAHLPSTDAFSLSELCREDHYLNVTVGYYILK